MSPKKEDFFTLDPEHVDPARVKREREKARKLRKSQWWLTQLSRGLCHYCRRSFPATQLTMDHVVPIARGGTSTPGNIVPACSACNRDKKLRTPADDAFEQLERERKLKGRSPAGD
ncbi:MAG TPA: HNH endonuclease [Bdellovibrionota bacterium]|nr:HNH endonuclease [Bdellovibrionota bacterium]